jgi:hypothetical protein
MFKKEDLRSDVWGFRSLGGETHRRDGDLVGMMSAPNLRRRPACHGHADCPTARGTLLARAVSGCTRAMPFGKKPGGASGMIDFDAIADTVSSTWATFREKSTVRPFRLFPHPATHTGASSSRSL